MRNILKRLYFIVVISFVIGCASASPQETLSLDLQKYETTTLPKFEMNGLCRYYIVSVHNDSPRPERNFLGDRMVLLRQFSSPVTPCIQAAPRSFVEVLGRADSLAILRWFSVITENIEAIEVAFNTIETVACKLDRQTYYNSLERIMIERGKIGTSVISLSFDSTICARTVPVTRMNAFAGYGITLRYVPDFEILSVGPGIP